MFIKVPPVPPWCNWANELTLNVTNAWPWVSKAMQVKQGKEVISTTSLDSFLCIHGQGLGLCTVQLCTSQREHDQAKGKKSLFRCWFHILLWERVWIRWKRNQGEKKNMNKKTMQMGVTSKHSYNRKKALSQSDSKIIFFFFLQMITQGIILISSITWLCSQWGISL